MFIAVMTVHVVPAQIIRFETGPAGTVPPGWSIAMTHKGGAPKWQIIRDASAPSPPFAFGQISQDRTAGRFPLAIWDGASIRNGEVGVAFKTVSGTVDQAAGIVWRYQNPNNYYIARANALESNIVLYKVENGVRLSIAPLGTPSRSYGIKHEVPKGKWCTLRVAFEGSRFRVFFNAQLVFETEDASITNAGKAGLWTKADSVIYFDDFSVAGH
jgi:hypothetical protein